MNNTDMTRPVLISGITFGVITAIPPFSVLNVCTCCSLFAAAGFLAAYLLRKDSPVPITAGKGALVGLVSGAFGGVVHTAFSIPVALLVQSLIPVNQELAERILEGLGSENHPLARLLREYTARGVEAGSLFSAIWFFATITKLIMTVVLFGLFAMLGGILAVVILNKREKPTIYVPPPAKQEEPPALEPPIPPAQEP